MLHLKAFKKTNYQCRYQTKYEVGACHQLRWVENASQWPNLQSVVCVKSNKRQEGVRYYISSVAKLQTEQAYKLSPQHWSVENKLIGRRPCGN